MAFTPTTRVDEIVPLAIKPKYIIIIGNETLSGRQGIAEIRENCNIMLLNGAYGDSGFT